MSNLKTASPQTIDLYIHCSNHTTHLSLSLECTHFDFQSIGLLYTTSSRQTVHTDGVCMNICGAVHHILIHIKRVNC